MAYYKKVYLLILSVIILSGCSPENGEENLSLAITDFQPSYSQVLLKWELNRPNNIIVQDLQIYRIEKNTNDSNPYVQPVLIANLPSNETTYTDVNVPYKSEVTYTVHIRYRISGDTENIDHFLDSEPRAYTRNLVLFNQAPLQVQQDPLDSNFFHILERASGTGALKKYSFSQHEVALTKTFTDGWSLSNRFHIVNNEIYVADTHGKISRMNAQNYQVNGTYNTVIEDNLNAFAIDGDRIYYQDEDIWNYYTISSGISTIGHIVTQMDYAETLNSNQFLFLYAQQGSNGVRIVGYSPQNCNSSSCFPDYTIYPTGPATVLTYKVDPYLFTWNPTKQKFITSYEGWVINVATLQPELKLTDITGKHYFQFAYDNEDNIYATVQGEKIIHKFNSNYELVDTITTKLYPLFPMITNDVLQVVGSYEPVAYWGFWYGYEFNFNVKCAIEVFQ